MHYYERFITRTLQNRLQSNPAVALLGPRQCGKSTLARHIQQLYIDSIYLDLELPSDLKKISEPELFFDYYKNSLICLDEIQLKPELFSVLRSIIDKNDRNSQFLILGSASRDLIKQSSESLAGRISYLELTPFLFEECKTVNTISLSDFWLRGGFPRSLLNVTNNDSVTWRNDFIRSFVERDILQIKPGVSSRSISRLLQMCAHVQGQTVNYSRLGASLSMSDNTIRHNLELLEGAFFLRILQPFHDNLKKRLIKSPKIYIRDSGLLHALLGIETFDNLLGHPTFGSSWETVVIENVIANCKPSVQHSFYRTAKGEEMDLVLEYGQKCIAIECKASTTPDVTRSMQIAINDLKPDHTFIVAPVDTTYPLSSDITVTSLTDIFKNEIMHYFTL